MVSPELTARLRYLNDSAHLLATTAPETSRQLMSQCNALMFDNELDHTITEKQTACGACGTIILLGWEGKLESQSERLRDSKKGKVLYRPMQPRALLYECGTCGRKTRQHIKLPLPAKRHMPASSASRPVRISEQYANPPAGCSPSTETPSVNSSSKKRAKTRKGGLAAILAQKNTSNVSGSGYDLMDFMKKA